MFAAHGCAVVVSHTSKTGQRWLPSLWREPLRGDAICPPDRDEDGLTGALGALHIRRPFVRFASDGIRLFIKGFEFEVENVAATGEHIDSRALKEGLVSLVYRYVNPDTGKSSFGIVPYTFIFEMRESLPYTAGTSTGTAEAIKTGYMRLVAETPPGVDDNKAFYIPAGAGELALMLICRGTIGEQTKPSLSLGGYWFGPVVKRSTRFTFYRQYGGNTGYWGDLDVRHPGDIFTIMPTGEDLRNITRVDPSPGSPESPYTGFFDPSWSPDGSRLAINRVYCSNLYDQEPTPEYEMLTCEEDNF